jgi:phospholipid/cholesterol/gamma-HCH transport system substrate-binding protein
MRRPQAGSVASLTSIAIVAILSVSYLLFSVARVDWFTEKISVVMIIPDAANLSPGSPVLLSGMHAGRVSSVRNVAGGVEVNAKIDEQMRIPTDSAVVIEALSALGEPYIDFRPTTGDGPYITDGQMIEGRTVNTPSSIPEVASTVTAMLQQLDPEAIASVTSTFAEALAGTDAVRPQLTHATDLLATTLIARLPQIRQLLTNAQTLGPQMPAVGEKLSDGGRDISAFGAKVREVVDALEVLLNARPVPDAYTAETGLIPLLPKLTAFIDSLGPDARQMYPAFEALTTRAASSLQNIDLSALIAQALASVSDDGAVRLEVNPK